MKTVAVQILKLSHFYIQTLNKIFSSPPKAKASMKAIQCKPVDLRVFHLSSTHSFSPWTNNTRWQLFVCPSHARSLGVQHLDEQIIAGHLSTQMHVAQVVLSLRAEGAQLRQPHHQLAELLLELRVGGQGVLQQSAVHLLLDAIHERLVLKQLYICREIRLTWVMRLFQSTHTQLARH